jgi:ferredoxin
MGFSVSVDPDLCIGSGDCVRLVPLAFQIDETRGVSVPLAGASSQALDRILEAATGCQVQAIRVVADDGTVLHASNGG